MIINCKDIRKDNLDSLKELGQVEGYVAFIQVGDNPASNTYINNKIKLCGELNITNRHYKLPEFIEQVSVLTLISELNEDDDCIGIMIQLPLPKHIKELSVIDAIKPHKDIDGFTTVNKGKLMIGDRDSIIPCTPLGILHILNHMRIDLKGKNIVIVGRSNIVGKPLANLLINEGATVTVCNSNTSPYNISYLVNRCDIFISAIGKPNYWNEEKLESCNIENTIAIDVGINRDKDNKLCGDIDKGLYDKFKAITPVPGGVGVMTVLGVIKNIYRCAGLI